MSGKGAVWWVIVGGGWDGSVGLRMVCEWGGWLAAADCCSNLASVHTVDSRAASLCQGGKATTQKGPLQRTLSPPLSIQCCSLLSSKLAPRPWPTRPLRRHPNVFPDGKVCISILHPPGEDAFNPQESAAERWSPVHTVRGGGGERQGRCLTRSLHCMAAQDGGTRKKIQAARLRGCCRQKPQCPTPTKLCPPSKSCCAVPFAPLAFCNTTSRLFLLSYGRWRA